MEVYSDASQRNVAEFAVQYAAFHHAFDTLIAPPGRHSPPGTVILFRNIRTLQGYAEESPAIKREDLVSLSSEYEGYQVDALALEGDRSEALLQVFDSDATWLLQGLGYYVPLCVRQGTGEFFSTFELRGDECVLGDDDRRYDYPIQNPGFLSWSKFFDVTTSSPEYGLYGHVANGVYQAQCWALMHTVLAAGDGKMARERFQRLVALLADAKSPQDAFCQFFQTRPGYLNSAVDSVSMARTFRIPFPRAAVQAQLRIEPAPESDVRAKLYDLLSAHDQLAAEVQLDHARALNPHSPVVNLALAHQALRNGDKSGAAEYFRTAIAAGAQDGLAYYYSASDRLDAEIGAGAIVVGRGGDAALAAIQELHRSIALLPGFDRSYLELGRAYLAAPHVTRAAIADLEPALQDPELAPNIRFYIGILDRRIGDRAAAKAVFTALAQDNHVRPGLRRGAQEQVEAIEEAAHPRPKPTPVAESDSDRPPVLERGPPQPAPPPPPYVLQDITLSLGNSNWNTYQSYLGQLVDKVEAQFHAPDAPGAAPFHGKFVLSLTLGSDGGVSDIVSHASPDVNPALVQACQKALEDAAPFGVWDDSMTDQMGHEQHLALRFNF